MSSSAVAQVTAGMPTAIEFGPFRFDPVRRELVHGDGPLRVGSRALQLLEVLLEAPGRLYSRDELVERVWPRTIVEETSLRVHMSALRRALRDGIDGARYITNVPGRGYSFVAEVRKVSVPRSVPSVAPVPPSPAATGNAPALPSRLTRTIGRDLVIAQIGGLLARERLVSIVGAGGMGKTTVALSVAEELARGGHVRFDHGVFLVDLSRISDPAFVAVELGQAQGLNVSPGDPPHVIEAVLRDKRALIVVDNCEHVIDAVAVLLDRLLRACPGVRFLSTSREPLEAEGEWVFKLAPLAMPGEDDRLDIPDLLAYPAIQLFVQRAKATSDAFELTEAHAWAVRQLCRSLDGMPLAIELAAARVDSLGVQGLIDRLENVFDLLTRGRRTALSRHRTLQAVFDWSYDLLSDSEKQVFQRLSVFRGWFDLDGAVRVASSDTLPPQRVIDDVLGLCAKSLIVLEGRDDGQPVHRMLFITRLYAERRLADAPDAHELRRRHALFMLDLLFREQEASVDSFHEGRAPDLGCNLADLRAAIEWAMVREHDLAVGLQLTDHSERAYRNAGLVEEYRHYVDTALGKVSLVSTDRERLELGLRMAWAFMTGFTTLDSLDQQKSFARLRQLIDEVGTDADRLQALYGMCVGLYGQGDYRAVMAVCEEVRQLARDGFEQLSVMLADRFTAMCLHALGDHDAAQVLALRVMGFNAVPIGPRFISEVPVGASMRAVLAKIHWLRGDFALAWSTLVEALECSRNAHFFSRGLVLAVAGIPLAIWKGELAIADRWTTDLSVMAEQKQLPYWHVFARVYRSVLDGEPIPYGGDLHHALERHTQLSDLATVLIGGPPGAAAMRRVEDGAVGWNGPEVLRLAALPNLQSGSVSLHGLAVAGLERGMAMAKRQGARFWMLRIALTICSACVGGELEVSALDTLRTFLADKDDGSSVAELVAARAVLKERA